MNISKAHKFKTLLLTISCCVCISPVLQGQEEESLEEVLQRIPEPAAGFPARPLPDNPMHYETAEGMQIEVAVIARGLNHPWSLAALPDGTLLVTERNNGQLRAIRGGVLDPQPIKGMPAVKAGGYAGLNDVVLHPDFDSNSMVYISYLKPLAGDDAAIAVMRGRYEGTALRDTQDIYVADKGVTGSSRLLFDQAGLLYVSFYGSQEEVQDLARLNGKIIRLTDTGAIPADNPFVEEPGARAEIYTLGHRTPQGMVEHPVTGEIWSMEMGPNGGDEINILTPGANYGWPYVSLGRDYAGEWQGVFQKAGFVDPVAYWMPSISVSGMVFYTGTRLPAWRGDLLVGGLRTGEIPGTGMIQRIRFNDAHEEIRRETLLADLHTRFRGVYQDNDGYLYVLTDQDDGAVLRIGPAE